MAATKELLIYREPNGFLFGVRYEGGGQLPKELTGHFTSIDEAARHIERYKAKRTARKGKGVVDDG